MKTKQQLKEVGDATFKMGMKMHDKFNKKGGIENLRASVSAFNVTVKAIKYRLIFKK